MTKAEGSCGPRNLPLNTSITAPTRHPDQVPRSSPTCSSCCWESAGTGIPRFDAAHRPRAAADHEVVRRTRSAAPPPPGARPGGARPRDREGADGVGAEGHVVRPHEGAPLVDPEARGGVHEVVEVAREAGSSIWPLPTGAVRCPATWSRPLSTPATATTGKSACDLATRSALAAGTVGALALGSWPRHAAPARRPMSVAGPRTPRSTRGARPSRHVRVASGVRREGRPASARPPVAGSLQARPLCDNGALCRRKRPPCAASAHEEKA